MIDQNLLRTHLDEVANALKIKRNFILDVEQVKALEEKRKVLQVKQKHCKQNVMHAQKILVQQKRVAKIFLHYWRK